MSKEKQEFDNHSIYLECFSCKFKEDIPGDTHVKCIKPDQFMQGHSHGIKRGWFNYPINFDPVWKLTKCNNYLSKKGSS